MVDVCWQLLAFSLENEMTYILGKQRKERLFNHRFYDWPPEPKFSDVKPDLTAIGLAPQATAIASTSFKDEALESAKSDKQKKRWFGSKKKKDD